MRSSDMNPQKWKEHFAKLYSIGDAACVYDVRADVLNDDIDSPDVNEICMDDIVKAMTQLKSGKSCVQMDFAQRLSNVVAKCLLYILNFCSICFWRTDFYQSASP